MKIKGNIMKQISQSIYKLHNINFYTYIMQYMQVDCEIWKCYTGGAMKNKAGLSNLYEKSNITCRIAARQ